MKSPVFRLFLIFMFLCTLPFASAANKALVIGNNAYDSGGKFSRLSNPITDANRVADALRSIGFSVTMKKDLNSVDFRNTMNNFAKSLQDTDIAFVYYAGHGLSYESNDYLVPVSPSIELPESLQHVGIKAQEMLDVISARSKHTVFVLDSCRDNPFFRSAAVRGVGFIQPNNRRSSYILYAAQKGGTARDDGTFARVLAQELRQPQSIDDIRAKVLAAVLKSSNGEQYPNAINNLSIGSLYFMKKESAAQSATQSEPATPKPRPTPPPSAQTISAEELFQLGENSYNRGDKQQAQQFWEQAAAQGYAPAQGILYYYGLGVTQDYGQAKSWYEKAVAQGNADGQNGLGALYYYGYGVTKDYGQAKFWFEKAAAQNQSSAQAFLGDIYQHGLGVTQDSRQAKFWLEKAAAQGNMVAQNNLGYLYEHGLGVTKDYSQAKFWYEKAALQGNVYGQSNLGDLYYYGKGVAQDYQKAKYWYEKAVAHGNMVAQSNLGYLYYYGKGVAQDYQKAKYWWEKAAAQGDQDAQDHLTELKSMGY